eukprot:scaffold40574_cov27-Tisochrysis_lutea.AAC.20
MLYSKRLKGQSDVESRRRARQRQQNIRGLVHGLSYHEIGGAGACSRFTLHDQLVRLTHKESLILLHRAPYLKVSDRRGGGSNNQTRCYVRHCQCHPFGQSDAVLASEYGHYERLPGPADHKLRQRAPPTGDERQCGCQLDLSLAGETIRRGTNCAERVRRATSSARSEGSGSNGSSVSRLISGRAVTKRTAAPAISRCRSNWMRAAVSPMRATAGAARKPCPGKIPTSYSSPTYSAPWWVYQSSHGTRAAEKGVRPSATTAFSVRCHTWKGTPSGMGISSAARKESESSPTALKSTLAPRSKDDVSTRSVYASPTYSIASSPGKSTAFVSPAAPVKTSAPDSACTTSKKTLGGSASGAAQCSDPNSYETNDTRTTPTLRRTCSVTCCEGTPVHTNSHCDASTAGEGSARRMYTSRAKRAPSGKSSHGAGPAENVCDAKAMRPVSLCTTSKAMPAGKERRSAQASPPSRAEVGAAVRKITARLVRARERISSTWTGWSRTVNSVEAGASPGRIVPEQLGAIGGQGDGRRTPVGTGIDESAAVRATITWPVARCTTTGTFWHAPSGSATTTSPTKSAPASFRTRRLASRFSSASTENSSSSDAIPVATAVSSPRCQILKRTWSGSGNSADQCGVPAFALRSTTSSWPQARSITTRVLARREFTANGNCSRGVRRSSSSSLTMYLSPTRMPDRAVTPCPEREGDSGRGGNLGSRPSRRASSSSTKSENSNKSSERPPSASWRLIAASASSPSTASPPYSRSARCTSTTERDLEPSTSTTSKALRMGSGTRRCAASSSARERGRRAPVESTHLPVLSVEPLATRQPSSACMSLKETLCGTDSEAAQCDLLPTDEVTACKEANLTVRAARWRASGSSTRAGRPSSTSNSAVAAR